MKTLILFFAIIFSLTGEHYSQTFPRNQTVETCEYFINVDPGEGNGTPITAQYGSSTVNTTFNAQLTRYDVIYIRFKSSNGEWSAARGYKYKYNNIILAEYYIKYANGNQTNPESMYVTNDPPNTPLFLAVSNNISSLANDDSVFVRFQSDNFFLSSWMKESGQVTGIGDGNNNLPKEFILLQNYPNPFNPSTEISYSIPQTNFVSLKIYDVLGKEIATLVNEEKSIGNYTVEFSASNLSSGIYFYRMQAGSFTDTKKFILLR